MRMIMMMMMMMTMMVMMMETVTELLEFWVALDSFFGFTLGEPPGCEDPLLALSPQLQPSVLS